MNEQEYQDKLKVRGQLSQADRLRVLEHEFEELNKTIQTVIADQLSTLQFDNAQLVNQIDSLDQRMKALENKPAEVGVGGIRSEPAPITEGDHSIIPAPPENET